MGVGSSGNVIQLSLLRQNSVDSDVSSHALAVSIFLYACETSAITADIERRIKIRRFHKLLGILYRDHLTNEEVKARMGNAIGPYEDLSPYAPQGSTTLLPKLSVTSKVSARTSCAWVGSRVRFRSSEDVTLVRIYFAG